MEKEYVVNYSKWIDFYHAISERGLIDKEFDLGLNAGLLMADAIIHGHAALTRCKNCDFSASDGHVCIGNDVMPPHETRPDGFCSESKPLNV